MNDKKLKHKKSHQATAARKIFLKRLDYFCHWNQLDLDIVTAVYGGSPKYLHFFYDGGWNLISGVNHPQTTDDSKIRIWLGNSDTSSNNHLDAIEMLARYQDEEIEITCPLSYGFEKAYGDFISDKGTKVFKSKWHSIRNFASIDKYLEMQKKVDVVVMFHNRTQAAGNVIGFVKMGKKIYLKSQSTLFKFLEEHGIIVFDANSIQNLTFEEFSKPLTITQMRSNSQLITQLFSEQRKIECYEKILLEN